MQNKYRCCRDYTQQLRATGVFEFEDSNLSVVDVIIASCAGPSFFPPVNPIREERDYVDCGMWANCPCLMAVMEAPLA
jgi:patatin-like phospholipase/acyl hydrolase